MLGIEGILYGMHSKGYHFWAREGRHGKFQQHRLVKQTLDNAFIGKDLTLKSVGCHTRAARLVAQQASQYH